MYSQWKVMAFGFSGTMSRPSGSSIAVIAPNGCRISAKVSIAPAVWAEKMCVTPSGVMPKTPRARS